MEYERLIAGELLGIILLLVVLCLLHIERIKKMVWKQIAVIRIFLKRMLHGALFYLLWLVPRKKDLVVFGADNGSAFAGNPKYLFQEAQKHPSIRPVWITKNSEVCQRMMEHGYAVYMSSSWKGIWTQLRAGILIHSHSIIEDFCYLFVGGATSINCWHGVGLKRSWFRNQNAFSGKWMNSAPSLRRSYHLWWARSNMARRNYVIGTSEEVTAYYPDTFQVEPDHVLNLGQARNDLFYDDSLEDGELPDCFQNGKIIVYMPTHRNYGVSRGGKAEKIGENIDFEKLSGILRKYGYTFVIKQHRWNTQAGRHSKYGNIIDISKQNYNLDTQMILKYTDILITDYSSCYTDFLLLDRPVVFYCYDLDKYLDRWELNFDYDYVTPGPKVFNSDELIDALEKLMQGQDGYEAERQRVKRVFYSPENQGPAAQKQMDYILENIIGK